MLLYKRVRQHGAPEALITDNGRVFLAKQAKRFYNSTWHSFGIRKEEFAHKQPWQSYIDGNFGV